MVAKRVTNSKPIPHIPRVKEIANVLKVKAPEGRKGKTRETKAYSITLIHQRTISPFCVIVRPVLKMGRILPALPMKPYRIATFAALPVLLALRGRLLRI